jgi:hypothetical protein
MARPKGKMFALLAVFVAIALVAATGAFTSVDAERTVAVNVSDDSDALLQLEPSGGDNGDYATESGSTVEVTLDDSSDANGAGINDNATTVITRIFNVTNQGTQDVGLNANITGTESGVDIYVLANDTDTGNNYNLSSSGPVTGVSSGGSPVSIGLKIVTDDAGSSTNFDATLTLTADEADS